MSSKRDTGIPDLPPNELEQWTNGLVAFLTSKDVPGDYRGWAARQAERLDAYLAAGADPDELADEFDEEPVQAPRPAAKRAKRQQAPAPPPQPQLSGQLGKLAMGAAAGVILLAVIFGARALTDRGSADTLPSNVSGQEFNQARADELEALLAQNPENLDVLFELGEMNFQAGRNQTSIDWFKKLVELDPTDTHALTDIGTAYFNLGKPAEAKEWWLKVLDVDPNDVQAHYNMGFVYANAEPRDLNAAIAEWEIVMRLDPDSPLAQTAKVHIEGLRSEAAESNGETAPPEAEPTP